jgi:Domain of unknown function (DUF4160)
VPTVAIVNGVRIEFYFDEHPPPHFHARYAEFIAQIDIATLDIIKGSLPKPQYQDVRQWASSRQEELMQAWKACNAGRRPESIA